MFVSMLSVVSMLLGDIQVYILYFTNYVLIFLIVLHLWFFIYNSDAQYMFK